MGLWSRVFGKQPPPPPAVPPGKVWVMGTAPWGGVLLECGAMELVLVVMPVTDPDLYRQLPTFPPGTIKAVIACNDRDHGYLAGQQVARAAGVATLYATASNRAVDRLPAGRAPSAASIPVEQLRRLACGSLELLVHGDGAVWATWSNGVTALVGDAITLDAIREDAPMNVLGRIATRAASGPGDHAAVRGYVPIDSVPVSDRDDGRPVMDQILAAIIAGELDRADALAADAVDRGERASEMWFQRAIVAMMRGDDDAAIAALEHDPDDPAAATSLGQLYARRGDPRARALAGSALAARPDDSIAIRGAILAHALTGDPAGAHAILATHGAHLPREVRVAFAETIDHPPPSLRHRFPEHASAAAEAAKPLVDARRYAEAEPLLRRAVALDRTADEHVVELGHVLSQLGRDADAIAAYDTALAEGGSPLLRFNRANCLLRLERFAAAIDDYRACIAAIPERAELRVNLVSALHASGDAAAARRELDALRATGAVSPQLVTGLERMLADGYAR
ncbi:MAG TPA: tetratricopeptide repeat protein [Kofleriaceae bacterium]|nr:tetratricopeptide repeat protein [Kofleriaceae bacterium]